ncbi:MAG: hypothetical protein EOS55_01235 [Mesorhizobium sp.]|nr:MAG: hypothetical protein EOS55_01235 [Mesorhizobium sp.]
MTVNLAVKVRLSGAVTVLFEIGDGAVERHEVGKVGRLGPIGGETSIYFFVAIFLLKSKAYLFNGPCGSFRCRKQEKAQLDQ